MSSNAGTDSTKVDDGEGGYTLAVGKHTTDPDDASGCSEPLAPVQKAVGDTLGFEFNSESILKGAIAAATGKRNMEPDFGYLREHLPLEAPENSVVIDDILEEVDTFIRPERRLSEWQMPTHYLEDGDASYSRAVEDTICHAVGSVGVTWLASPVAVELEGIMLDWIAKILSLPSVFHCCDGNGQDTGGSGAILKSAIQAMYYSLRMAQHSAMERIKQEHPQLSACGIRPRMVAYASNHARDFIKKACDIAGIRLHVVGCDGHGRLDTQQLQHFVQLHKDDGCFPFYVMATLGTTSVAAFDLLDKMAVIASTYGMWLHADGAYCGLAFTSGDFDQRMVALTHVDSVSLELAANLRCTADFTCMWVKSPAAMESVSLQPPGRPKPGSTPQPAAAAATYRQFEMAISRRFASIQLWFLLRSCGVGGLRTLVNARCVAAGHFVSDVESDNRFVLPLGRPQNCSLVCFRMKGLDTSTEELLDAITDSSKRFMTGVYIDSKFMIRFTAALAFTSKEDASRTWKHIAVIADRTRFQIS